MQIKHLLPLLALAGIAFAGYSVVNSNKPMPVAAPVAEPASPTYNAFIAGSGIIEAQSQNVALGSPLARIVQKVVVKVGDAVKAQAPLFYLDDRETQAELAIKNADLEKALAEVEVAKANLQDAQSLYNLVAKVTDARAISAEEVLKRRNSMLIAKAKLVSAEAQVKQSQANIASLQVTLERLVVRAPIAGDVLQVNIRAGEFAPASALNTPLLVLGNQDKLHVRVDIDENDAWRFNKASKAVAYLRGNRDFKVELTLAYLEPYVVPKKSLTGDSTERVDTRVLQAIYTFARQTFPVYVGQQMDVFIDAPASAKPK